MQLAFRVLLLAASFVVETLAAVTCVNPTYQAKRGLQRRALPPCDRCPNSDSDWLSTFQPAAISIEASGAAPSDDWYPSGCGKHGWVCIEYGTSRSGFHGSFWLTYGHDRVDNGIEYSSGGFNGYPQGRWKKPNGKQVFLGQYWQGTVQFVGRGVTFNIYFAHCTTYILAKGASSYVIVDGTPRLAGGGEQCCGHAENIDVGLIQFLYAQGQGQ